MRSIKEKQIKDEKTTNLIENTCFISDNIPTSSSSLPPPTTINSNTIFTTFHNSEPAIAGEEDKNIYFKMTDNNYDLYDSNQTIYDPKKEPEQYESSILSPEGSLSNLVFSELIDFTDNLLSDGLENVIDFDIYTPISHGSPVMQEELEDNITSQQCIPPNAIHIHSQNNIDTIPTYFTNALNSNINSDDDDHDHDLDNDLDMEKLQPINISENNNVGVKRKMETITTTHSPTKKKRFPSKINTTLKAQKSVDIMTPQILDDVLSLEDKQKLPLIDNMKMCCESPVFKTSTNNIDFHQNVVNHSSSFLNEHYFHQIPNNNNIHKHSFNTDHYESIINQSIHNISIKDENPPSVVSSQFDDCTCSTPSTPLSCQQKRRRGRPRIDHRLEPTPSELKNLSEQDKKQKILRAKNNKASQTSRDKKRSKIQEAENQEVLQQNKNYQLKTKMAKLEKIQTAYKNILQKYISNKR